MKICVLDGEKITDKEALHSTLAECLGFPDWYGRNLDALYDCLTGMGENVEIRLRQTAALKQNLGGYAENLLRMLRDAAEENEKILVSINEK